MTAHRARSGFALDGDDNLTDLFVGFHEPVRLDDLAKWEDPGDDRLERALGQSLRDECDTAGKPLRITRDLEQRIATQNEPLRQRLEQREGGRLQAENAIEKNGAAFRRRVRQRLDIGACNGIKDGARLVRA